MDGKRKSNEWYLAMIAACEYWAGYYAALFNHTDPDSRYKWGWQFERYRRVSDYLKARLGRNRRAEESGK